MLFWNYASRLSKCFVPVNVQRRSIQYNVLRKQTSLSVSHDFECLPDIEDSDDFQQVSFQEEEVGIIKFLNEHEGFYGTVKSKWSDFLVNEILANGKIVRLTNLGSTDKLLKISSCSANEKITSILCNFLTRDVTEKVITLYEDPSSPPLLLNINHLNTVKRNILHTSFQRHFPKLKLKAKGKENEKYFLLEHSDTQNAVDQSPEEVHQSHLHFVLSKANISNFDAFSTVCNVLNVPLKKLYFGGLKDKKGATCQLISIDSKDVSVEKLTNINNCSNVKVGNFSYEKKPVTLGNIYGNHFEILVRDINVDFGIIKTAVENTQNHGFLNYFGMQRFGCQVHTSFMLVGKKLLQKNWENAVELILQPRAFTEHVKLVECRKVWWETRNPKAALSCLDYKFKFTREALLLKGLNICGRKEYKAALKCLPKAFLQFYLNSYDSYLWNIVMSERITRHGQKIVEGDILKHSTLSMNPQNNQNKYVSVKKNNLDSNELCFHDVVIPIFGSCVSLPRSEIGDLFRELLEADNLSEDIVNSHEFSVKYGLYRHVVAVPENLKWSTIMYDNAEEVILHTDFDKIRGTECFTPPKEGKKLALKLEFDLKSSCYATMALREIMKTQLVIEN